MGSAGNYEWQCPIAAQRSKAKHLDQPKIRTQPSSSECSFSTPLRRSKALQRVMELLLRRRAILNRGSRHPSCFRDSNQLIVTSISRTASYRVNFG
jgi:hypothetical protein